MSKQTKITKSAKGEYCQVRVSGVCRVAPENETTVLAHLNGGGIAYKSQDYLGAYACAECHTWLDGGYVKTHTVEQRDLYHLEGVARTLPILFEKGLLEVK